MKLFCSILSILSVFFLVSCGDDKETPKPIETSSVKIIKNIKTDSANTGRYIFYSLELGDTISRADSATNNWDIAFLSTTIIVNSNISGPGSAGAQLLVGIFDELTEAPLDGYLTDNLSSSAIGKWYNYNMNTHVVTPIPGRVIVVRTSDNKYAKIEIASYYKDAPVSPVNTDLARYYTFRVFYQKDGSRNLK